MFELRLKSFVNEYGKDSLGKCCSGSVSRTGECSGVCKTSFRVCLKQYQVNIDTTSACTYGDVVTPVLGENVVNLSANVAMSSFTNPIRFPFEFTWPVSFSSTTRTRYEYRRDVGRQRDCRRVALRGFKGNDSRLRSRRDSIRDLNARRSTLKIRKSRAVASAREFLPWENSSDFLRLTISSGGVKHRRCLRA